MLSVSAYPPYKLLSAWSNCYKTWCVCHGTWANLNGVLHQYACLYVYSHTVSRQRLGKNVTAATNTHATTNEFLAASFCMRSMPYQRKLGYYFSPEFLVFNLILHSSHTKTLLTFSLVQTLLTFESEYRQHFPNQQSVLIWQHSCAPSISLYFNPTRPFSVIRLRFSTLIVRPLSRASRVKSKEK
jgi:hypothetical protein